MANKMTLAAFNRYQLELRELRERQEVLLIEQVKAKDFGDLSENAENDAINSELNMNRSRMNRLHELLSDCEIVPPDTSPRITLGSKLEIVMVDSKTHEPLEEPMELVYDSMGDPVLMGVLGAQSPLGKLVNNGTDGIYTLPIGEGISYKVTKLFS